MKDDKFYVDDAPLARTMDEFPPEIHLERPPRKKKVDERYQTAPIIRRMRMRRGLSGAELSRRIGRHDTYIRTLENLDGSCRYETLAMIARACGYRIIITTEEKWQEYEQAYNSRKTGKRP